MRHHARFGRRRSGTPTPSTPSVVVTATRARRSVAVVSTSSSSVERLAPRAPDRARRACPGRRRLRRRTWRPASRNPSRTAARARPRRGAPGERLEERPPQAPRLQGAVDEQARRIDRHGRHGTGQRRGGRAAVQHGDRGAGRGAWHERLGAQRGADLDARRSRGPAVHEPPRQHEVGAHEPRGVQQAGADRLGDGPRRVGDDTERPARQAHRGCVGDDHRDRVRREAVAQHAGAAGVQLDGEDVGAGVDERGRQRAVTGAEVDDEIAGAHAGSAHDVARRVSVEPVEAPWGRPGASSRRRSRPRTRRTITVNIVIGPWWRIRPRRQPEVVPGRARPGSRLRIVSRRRPWPAARRAGRRCGGRPARSS